MASPMPVQHSQTAMSLCWSHVLLQVSLTALTLVLPLWWLQSLQENKNVLRRSPCSWWGWMSRPWLVCLLRHGWVNCMVGVQVLSFLHLSHFWPWSQFVLAYLKCSWITQPAFKMNYVDLKIHKCGSRLLSVQLDLVDYSLYIVMYRLFWLNILMLAFKSFRLRWRVLGSGWSLVVWSQDTLPIKT